VIQGREVSEEVAEKREGRREVMEGRKEGGGRGREREGNLAPTIMSKNRRLWC